MHHFLAPSGNMWAGVMEFEIYLAAILLRMIKLNQRFIIFYIGFDKQMTANGIQYIFFWHKSG